MTVKHYGLFGGTFDPPHFGHVAALRAAIASELFSEIEVTVAGDPYVKSDTVLLHPAEVRLAMAHAAFDGMPGVFVSDREIRRTGPSYTIDTVRELVGEGKTVDLILGADLVTSLPTWNDADEIARLVRVGVVPRPGSPTELPVGFEAYVIPMEPVDLSSTHIRSVSSTDQKLKEFMPDEVIPIYQLPTR